MRLSNTYSDFQHCGQHHEEAGLDETFLLSDWSVEASNKSHCFVPGALML